VSGRAGAYRPPAARATAWKPVSKMRQETSASIRKLASKVHDDHPGMGMHVHLKDAASALDRGDTHAAKRHLTAAIGNATPQSIRRHGIIDDQEYNTAKANMDAVHRHLLLVSDIADSEAHNASLPRGGEDMPEQGTATAPLAAVPAARQGSARAVNAPGKLPTGGTDVNVAKPQQVTGSRARQVAASWGDADLVAIELGHFFNDLEKRGRNGEWTRDDGGAIGGRLDQLLDSARKKYQRNSGDSTPGIAYDKATRHRDKARKNMAKGDWARAADHVDAMAAEIRSHRYMPPAGGRQAYPEDEARELDGIAQGLRKARQPVQLSAETARLAVTPAPRGRPGGPGLYNVKGNQHSPYLQHVVKALIDKRGMDPHRAYAVAWGALRKWRDGGGHVRPEVRAAAAGGLALEGVARARAHAQSHAISWDDVSAVIEMATLDFDWAKWDAEHGVDWKPDARGNALRKRGFSEKDVHAIRSHEAYRGAAMRKSMNAKAGTPGHARELRGLAAEADRRQQENATLPNTGRDGSSNTDLKALGGYPVSDVPASDTAASLRRAADMIDRGQPSLARAHARAIRASAATEKAAGLRPGYAARLSQAADKLSQLPEGQGLAATAPDTADSMRRTLAARAYAARTAPR